MNVQVGCLLLYSFLMNCARYFRTAHEALPPRKDENETVRKPAGCLHWQGVEYLCAKRCPVRLSVKGHDKEACCQHVKRSIQKNNNDYHVFVFGYGLCSVGVPCESRNPVTKHEKKKNIQ